MCKSLELSAVNQSLELLPSLQWVLLSLKLMVQFFNIEELKYMYTWIYLLKKYMLMLKEDWSDPRLLHLHRWMIWIFFTQQWTTLDNNSPVDGGRGSEKNPLSEIHSRLLTADTGWSSENQREYQENGPVEKKTEHMLEHKKVCSEKRYFSPFPLNQFVALFDVYLTWQPDFSFFFKPVLALKIVGTQHDFEGTRNTT